MSEDITNVAVGITLSIPFETGDVSLFLILMQVFPVIWLRKPNDRQKEPPEERQISSV